eukprot:GSMAST32.ASY1.ANO1.662.1 assembled CDS
MAKRMTNLVNFCKRRGFVFPGSSIYGGFANSYDYGPLGAQLRKNLQDKWWSDFIVRRHDCVGLESSVIMSPRVWEASGHTEEFTDPLVECLTCHKRFHDLHTEITSNNSELSKPKLFNLMFKTEIGVTEDASRDAFLRPETAQGAYINYYNTVESMRRKLPFGVGQMGKSFRNEVTPGNFIFRTREFDQLELQYFCEPGTSSNLFKYWVDESYDWLLKLGIKSDHLRKREHGPNDMAHYALQAIDIEYKYPWGWGELWGIVRRHMEASGQDMRYIPPGVGGKKDVNGVIPHVVEPALGLNRLLLAILLEGLMDEDIPKQSKGSSRSVMRISPLISPYTIAILPITKKSQFVEKANEVYTVLSQSTQNVRADIDFTGSIGKRYRRQDEIGTPICLTIDHQTMDDGTVTLRSRDSLAQMRVSLEELSKDPTALCQTALLLPAEENL